MTHQEQKKAIRRQMTAAKAALTREERDEAAAQLATRAFEALWPREWRAVMAYWPMADEIDTRPLIWRLRHAGVPVFLPVMEGENLTFRLFEGEERLAPDPHYGIMQPRAAAPVLPQMVTESGGAGAAVITPGVAFAPGGGRMGRGRGFYDRLFETLLRAWRIGVGFACQQVDELPTEPHDATMDLLILP